MICNEYKIGVASQITYCHITLFKGSLKWWREPFFHLSSLALVYVHISLGVRNKQKFYCDMQDRRNYFIFQHIRVEKWLVELQARCRGYLLRKRVGDRLEFFYQHTDTIIKIQVSA
jgi:hypothetical protein